MTFIDHRLKGQSTRGNYCACCFSYNNGYNLGKSDSDILEDYLQAEAKCNPNPTEFLNGFYNALNEGKV